MSAAMRMEVSARIRLSPVRNWWRCCTAMPGIRGIDVSGNGDFSGFADASEVAFWAQEAMAWAVDMGLIHGTDEGKLVPNSGATRAEVAVLLQRFAALK